MCSDSFFVHGTLQITRDLSRSSMAEQETKSGPKRNVMIAVDSSVQSEYIFDWYIDNLRQERDNLLVFHCHELPHPGVPQVLATAEWQQIVAESEAKLKKLEQKYKEKCEAVPISAKIVVHGGKPGHAICEAAKQKSADVIVLGTRGLGTIRRTVLGSVSSYVLHHGDVPVAVIPFPN